MGMTIFFNIDLIKRNKLGENVSTKLQHVNFFRNYNPNTQFGVVIDEQDTIWHCTNRNNRHKTQKLMQKTHTAHSDGLGIVWGSQPVVNQTAACGSRPRTLPCDEPRDGIPRQYPGRPNGPLFDG